ncbi:hypothetical protein ACHHYP_10628 [Achlya hypogyna]|uniref:Uncharacterized protein n=1 Tax=Achlya hypogyna TaxID=1202772 RepID=A0A1V9YKX0_ACHHY|nr:hypothetical protein ACHHYP_10628 [Achlya hypogyna]
MVQVPPVVDAADMELWERESAPMFTYPVRCGSTVTRLTAIQDRGLCSSEAPTVASHGHCVWDAALVLAEYLQSTPRAWKQVVELGAGVGLVGMTLAAMGVNDVVLTDQAYCLPLLHKNVEVNFSSSMATPPRVAELQWGETAPANLRPDLVVASDILYNVKVFPALVATLAEIMTPTSTMYMAVETRNAAVEREFFAQLAGGGFACSIVGLDALQTRLTALVPYPEEISVYHITVA